MTVCFLAFVGLTIWYITWDVAQAQHVWCHIINTLNTAPAPKGEPSTNPSRAYEQTLAQEFKQLKDQLGC
jgi:hypothetical protein